MDKSKPERYDREKVKEKGTNLEPCAPSLQPSRVCVHVCVYTKLYSQIRQRWHLITILPALLLHLCSSSRYLHPPPSFYALFYLPCFSSVVQRVEKLCCSLHNELTGQYLHSMGRSWPNLSCFWKRREKSKVISVCLCLCLTVPVMLHVKPQSSGYAKVKCWLNEHLVHTKH